MTKRQEGQSRCLLRISGMSPAACRSRVGAVGPLPNAAVALERYDVAAALQAANC